MDKANKVGKGKGKSARIPTDADDLLQYEGSTLLIEKLEALGERFRTNGSPGHKPSWNMRLIPVLEYFGTSDRQTSVMWPCKFRGVIDSES